MGEKTKQNGRPEMHYKFLRRGKWNRKQCAYCGRLVSRTRWRIVRRKGLKPYVCIRCAKKRGIRGKPF